MEGENQDLMQQVGYLPGSMQVPMEMFDVNETTPEDPVDDEPMQDFMRNSIPPHSGANMMSTNEVPQL